jgi:hypothetical protein
MLSIPKLIFKRPISFGEKSNLILKWLRMRSSQFAYGYSFVTDQKVKFKVRSNHYQLINYLFTEERHIYPYLVKLLNSKSLLVDIGANIGLVSLPLTAATGCKTIAFEPARKTFLKLCENIFSNPHLEVFPLNLALSSHIFSGNITDTDSSGINQLQDDTKPNTAPCLSFTLDSISKQFWN